MRNIRAITESPTIPVNNQTMPLLRASLVEDDPDATIEIERRFEEALEARR